MYLIMLIYLVSSRGRFKGVSMTTVVEFHDNFIKKIFDEADSEQRFHFLLQLLTSI